MTEQQVEQLAHAIADKFPKPFSDQYVFEIVKPIIAEHFARSTPAPSVEGRSPRDGFNRNTEMWIWIPEEELDRIYQRVDLGESKPVRAFLWPHNDQVKELELLKFIPATMVSEKVAEVAAWERTAEQWEESCDALRVRLTAEKARADGLEKEVSELKGAFAVIPSDFTSQKHYEDMLTQAQARISELEAAVKEFRSVGKLLLVSAKNYRRLKLGFDTDEIVEFEKLLAKYPEAQ
jgi:hypothetical protein